MKSKGKIDSKAIQQLLIDHAEKFVIGAVSVLFLLLAWKTVALEGYKSQPKDLQEAASAAQSTMARGPMPPPPPPLVPPYGRMIEKFKEPIPREKYVWVGPVLPKFITQLRLRGAEDFAH